MQVAVLFARRDSIYKNIPGCDVWDEDRNALNWQGGAPIIGHPPCRLWGRLRQFSSAPIEEKELAVWCVHQVRRWTGVLEHPAWSTLWKHMGLPKPGEAPDAFGGWTLEIEQVRWGHKAEKKTWLYIVGAAPSVLPFVPPPGPKATHVISKSRRAAGSLPEVSKADRERTPPAFAHWLVESARRAWVFQ